MLACARIGAIHSVCSSLLGTLMCGPDSRLSDPLGGFRRVRISFYSFTTSLTRKISLLDLPRKVRPLHPHIHPRTLRLTNPTSQNLRSASTMPSPRRSLRPRAASSPDVSSTTPRSSTRRSRTRRTAAHFSCSSAGPSSVTRCRSLTKARASLTGGRRSALLRTARSAGWSWRSVSPSRARERRSRSCE